MLINITANVINMLINITANVINMLINIIINLVAHNIINYSMKVLYFT